MKHLKDSTLHKYANSDDLNKSIEAWAELDRRFYEKNPGLKEKDEQRAEMQFISDRKFICLSDGDLSEVEHDPRDGT